MTAFDEVKLDCFHFKGAIPCKPNKLYGVSCMNCSHYEKISTRILIIKLGALGDVIRSTPLLEPLRHKFPNAHITWLTLNPSLLKLITYQLSLLKITLDLLIRII